MIFFVIIAAIILLIFPFTRCLLLHPVSVIYYGIIDLYQYFKYKQYYIPSSDVGVLDCYSGYFGSGKTLSATRRLVSLYNNYNGKPIWIDGHWDKIQIRLISNVPLDGVPYEDLNSLQQLVDYTTWAPDHKNVFCLCLIDEASVQLNSRSFRDNIDPLFLNSLLCCRHFRLGLIYTAQRFATVDALLRTVTQKVYDCHKIWRVLLHNIYSGYELENASSPAAVKPEFTRSYFVSNSWFKSYNTLATVQRLKKSCADGDMKSSEEILQQVYFNPDINQISDKKLRKPFRKRAAK